MCPRDCRSGLDGRRKILGPIYIQFSYDKVSYEVERSGLPDLRRPATRLPMLSGERSGGMFSCSCPENAFLVDNVFGGFLFCSEDADTAPGLSLFFCERGIM